jgi:hypothetical protein
VDQSLEIQRLPGGGPPRFRFSAADDEPVRALVISLHDSETDELIWWLVNDPGEGEWYEVPAENVRITGGGPLDSYPVDHPDRVFAESMLAKSLREANAVAELVYGVVPVGYHQAKPTGGMPPPLQPGRRYSLAVWGTPSGGLVFEA